MEDEGIYYPTPSIVGTIMLSAIILTIINTGAYCMGRRFFPSSFGWVTGGAVKEHFFNAPVELNKNFKMRRG